MIDGHMSNQHADGPAPPPSASYLYGVAVDGLPSAAGVHGFGDLQDVVWHVAGHPATVTHLPPLFPVVQNLSDRGQGLGHPGSRLNRSLISV